MAFLCLVQQLPEDFRCLDLEFKWVAPTPKRPGHWIDNRGIGPQYFVEPNGTAFTLIGPLNLAGIPRETWHGESMNHLALGIENADTGDSGVAPGKGLGPTWWRMSDEAEDLTGMKLYLVLHPEGNEDAVLIWLAQFPQMWVVTNHTGHWAPRPGAGPPYGGSGDIDDRHSPATERRLSNHPEWKNMLFTERDYRSLALLCRLLAEQNSLPRNFPLLPYLDVEHDQPSAALFRQLILSDQRRDEIAQKLGTTTAIIQANGAAFTQWYSGPDDRWVDHSGNHRTGRIWNRFFGVDPTRAVGVIDTPCFRGFLAHAMNGHHPCPGPLFDWHRFAREVWDWWWYPFDTDAVAVTTTRRPYKQARRSTQLLDYYYDATGAAQDYNRLHPPLSLNERFLLPGEAVPVYAMANGVVVAARFALSSGPASSGFLLVRHEVFHQAGADHRIDYNMSPTFVWSLTYFLENADFSIPPAPPALPGATPNANPDWLNRFIMRLRECELAVQFHASHPENAALNRALNRGWAHNPSGAGPRLATGQEIERDAAAYRALANDLQLGRPVLFPVEGQAAPTPARVILGDFLGLPGLMAQGQRGIQIEIFSRDKLARAGRCPEGVFGQYRGLVERRNKHRPARGGG